MLGYTTNIHVYFLFLLYTLLQQPLGPTVMKQRHIKSSGYQMVNIPYWQYKFDATPEKKSKILRKIILDACAEYGNK